MMEQPMVVDFSRQLGRQCFGNLFDGAARSRESMSGNMNRSVGT